MSARQFKPQQRVVHVASGVVFRVVDVPPRLRIDGTGEPAYSLTRETGDDITLWVMTQAKAEDGRFAAETAP